MKALLIVLLCVLFDIIAFGQANYGSPEIGKPMPDFKLENVHHFTGNSITRNDLKNRWVIMDFWTIHCSACVQAFPKINELQQSFGDSLQFILIANNSKQHYRQTEEVYERYRKKLGLKLAIAFDSAIFEQFEVETVPHVIVIDPQGIVYAVTTGEFITRENIDALLRGNRPSYAMKYSTLDTASQPSHVRWNYLISTGNQQQEWLTRSIISKNNGEEHAGFWNIDYNVADGYYQIARASLSQLYNIAYWGESEWNRYMPFYNDHWPYPIVTTKDTTPFNNSFKHNRGYYNYSVALPNCSNKEELMKAMQEDLFRCFGYTVVEEIRMMPYWRLTATESAKRTLKSKSSVTIDERDPAGIRSKNIPIELVLSQIEEYNSAEKVPFIDETGIKVPVDVNYRAVMTDMTDVIRALRSIGLILEKKQRLMNVLVIKG